MSAIIGEGKEQFKSFIQERLLYQEKSLYSGIHENNFASMASKAKAMFIKNCVWI